MPIHRRGNRMPVGKMHSMRTGGRVSLFNYNPSIAGGKIAVKRFHRSHYLGVPMRNWRQQHMGQMVAASDGKGLHAPGSGARSGMGVADMVKAGRKRILGAIGEQFSKRARA